ncbi:hypothetical protein HDV03_001925 [Kappamyces sp. JEL0829]|nr:hypothetical protein HDV03_001925 [Kappamyces sp. JEL0829]
MLQESTQQKSPQNNQYFAPLLLDALGGGKRPNKQGTQSEYPPFGFSGSFSHPPEAGFSANAGVTMHKNGNDYSQRHSRRRSARSKSRERSLTPGIFGASPPLPENDVQDAPPLLSMHSMTIPAQPRAGSPVLYRPGSPNLASSSVSSRPPSLRLGVRHDDQMLEAVFDDSPMEGAMDVDRSSPLQKQNVSPKPKPAEFALSPNTPASLSSTHGSTVTLIGFPPQYLEWVEQLAASYGPICHMKKGDKVSANWLVVVYLNYESAERALLLDGQLMDQSWFIVAKPGDVFGALSPKKPRNNGTASDRPSARPLMGATLPFAPDSPASSLLGPNKAAFSPYPSISQERSESGTKHGALKKKTLVLDEALLASPSTSLLASTPSKVPPMTQIQSPTGPVLPNASPIYTTPSILRHGTPDTVPKHSQGAVLGSTLAKPLEQDGPPVVQKAGWWSTVSDYLFGF